VAFELSRRGSKVALVERSELAAGASGRNHGLLLMPLDAALGPMAELSSAVYREVAANAPLPVPLDEEPIGFLIVADDDDDERAAARAEAEAASEAGVRVERLDPGGLHRAEPALSDALAEGWLLHDGLRLDPAALTVALGLMAQDLGADVRRHLTARSLLIERDAVRGVVTDEGPLQADTVVLAAGPWSAGLLRKIGVDLPVVGARGWLVHLAPPAPPLRRLVGRAGWHTLPDQEILVPTLAADIVGDRSPSDVVASSLLQPNPDGTLLAGGSRQAAVTDEPEDPEVPRAIVRKAVQLVPALAQAVVLSAWWGVRPMTADGRPIVGSPRDGLVVATGHGSQGVILGGGTAKLVASMVLGEEPPFDPRPFDPDRFDSHV
jgi:glycine/D-amino acid oxidase-like deaminating enzyme